MNKRQRKKARRKQIRLYTWHGAAPGPFRTMKSAIRYARRHGDQIVFRWEFGWRTIHWPERVVRAPALWGVSLVVLTKGGVVRRSTHEAVRRMGPFEYGKVAR
jgi:hypothetical protein